MTLGDATPVTAGEPALAGARAPAAAAAGPTGAETSGAMRGLFGRDALYVLLWGLQLAFAAAVTPAATRLLSSSQFGGVTVCIAIMQVLVAVGSMSLQSAVTRQYHMPDGQRQARRLVTLAVAISAITFAIAYLTGPEWSSFLHLHGGFHGAIPYAVGWAAMTAVSNAGLGWLRCRDQLRLFATVSLTQSVGAALLSLLLVAVVRANATEFVLGQFIAQAVAVAIALLAARPLPIRLRDLAMVRGALRYSGALVPAAIAALGLGAAGRLIVQHDLFSSAVARYSIATNIAAIPLTLLAVLDSAWMPRFFALSSRFAVGELQGRSRDAIYALLIPTIIGLNMGAPIVLAAWAPPSYKPGGLLVVVAIVSVAALPMAGMVAATRMLLVSGRTGPVGSRTVLASAITIALTVALVPPLGIEGAALASLLGYLLMHVLMAHAARSVDPLPNPSRSLVAKCAATVAVAALSTQIPTGPVFIVARGLIAAACAVLFAAMLAELIAPGRFPALARLAHRVHSDAISS